MAPPINTQPTALTCLNKHPPTPTPHTRVTWGFLFCCFFEPIFTIKSKGILALDVYEYDVQGNTTNIVLCRINKHAARFFLSNFVNAGFSVIDRGKVNKDDCAEPSTVAPYLEDDKGYVILHNIGKVYEDWASAPSLADALANLARHKVKVSLKEWYTTRFQKKPVLEFSCAD